MILTCPQCATRFVVADSRIDPRLPEVSHAACGAGWVLGMEAAAPEPDVQPSPWSDEPVPEGPVDYTPALRMAAPEPAHDFPEFDRDRLREQLTWATTLPKRRAVKFAAGASLSLAGSAELMLLFHEQIARVWPTMAHLYISFGL